MRMKLRAVVLILLACAATAFPACGRAPAQKTMPATTGRGSEPVQTREEIEGQTKATPIDRREGTHAGMRANAPAERTPELWTNASEELTAAQIIAFYNEHANAIKTASKITIRKHDLRTTQVHVPAVLQKLAPDILRNVYPDKDETIAGIFIDGRSGKGHINDFMPVNGSGFVSKLSAAFVQSASRTAYEDGWRIRINLKDEPLDLDTLRQNAGGIENISELDRNTITDRILLQSGYGSCMDMVFIDFFREDGEKPGNFDLRAVKAAGTLQNGEITAFVDREGRMASLTLSYTSRIDIRYLGIKIKLSGDARQEYQLSW